MREYSDAVNELGGDIEKKLGDDTANKLGGITPGT